MRCQIICGGAQVQAELGGEWRSGRIARDIGEMIKGPAIARWLYPGWSRRGYVDIDLLVAPDRFQAAAEVLCAIGYESLLPQRWRPFASSATATKRSGGI